MAGSLSSYDIVVELVCGSIGGAVGCAMGHPLDTIKVRLQGSTAYRYTSAINCARITLAEEGTRGLYKGLTPPLLLTGLYQSVAFASFRLGMQLVPSNGSDNPCDESTAPLLNLFLAGCFAGACTVVVTTPSDLLKVRMQLQTSAGNTQTLRSCIAGVYRGEGLAGFARGAVATAYRDTWSTGLYFLAYHATKRTLIEGGPNMNPEISSSSSSNNNGSSPGINCTVAELFAGGIAGMAAWGTVIPFDVVKTRLQSQTGSCPRQERRFWPTWHAIVAKEGARKLYSGAGPMLSRAFIVNATTFWGYEEALRAVRSRWG